MRRYGVLVVWGYNETASAAKAELIPGRRAICGVHVVGYEKHSAITDVHTGCRYRPT